MGDTPDEAAPSANQVAHSPLVGFMSVPVHRRLPIRRSTLLMAVAFVGFGTLLYFNPPDSTPAATGQVLHTPSGDFLIPGAIKLPADHYDHHHDATTAPRLPWSPPSPPPRPRPPRGDHHQADGGSDHDHHDDHHRHHRHGHHHHASPARTGGGSGTSTTRAP